MGFLNRLFRGDRENEQPRIEEDQLIRLLNYCREQDLPLHHRFHGEIRVKRVQEDCFFADSEERQGLMFPYKYFKDGLITLPPEALQLLKEE